MFPELTANPGGGKGSGGGDATIGGSCPLGGPAQQPATQQRVQGKFPEGLQTSNAPAEQAFSAVQARHTSELDEVRKEMAEHLATYRDLLEARIQSGVAEQIGRQSFFVQVAISQVEVEVD